MVRSLGIDPGTGSFDLVLIDGDRVIWERSIPTIEVARNPRVLIDAVLEAPGYDVIIGPSGYGSPVICNEDIINPREYAIKILLLTREEDIVEGFKQGDIGIMVYKAIVDAVVEFWKMNLPVCYIPSIILLPTIPRFRKFNKIDMGTADKLAVTTLAIYDQSRRYGLDYRDVDFILVEMGYGYNAVIRVVNGVIVDAVGGTLLSPGFLTIGSIDAEIAVIGRIWTRRDVYHGGVASICGVNSIEEALEKRVIDEKCSDGFKYMFESILKNIYALISTTGVPREILLSGRLVRYSVIYDEIVRLLSNIASVRRLNGLDGAVISKEAGQGYALIGEGLMNGYFKKLVDHVGIRDAKGTVLDYVIHPKLTPIKASLLDQLKSIVRKPELFTS